MFLIKQVVDERYVTDLSLMKMKEGMQLKIDIIKSTRVRLTNKHGSIWSRLISSLYLTIYLSIYIYLSIQRRK